MNRATITIIIPDGYSTAEEFAKDCGFEIAADSKEPWRERWNGSDTERGWSIMHGRDIIAYIGGDASMSGAISEIVRAHNNAVRLKSPPGLDEDGMCNDHGGFMCKRCCPEVQGEN